MIWRKLFICYIFGYKLMCPVEWLTYAERSNWRWKQYLCNLWLILLSVSCTKITLHEDAFRLSLVYKLCIISWLNTDLWNLPMCSLQPEAVSSHLPYGPCLVLEIGPPLFWDFVDPCNWGPVPADPLPDLACWGYSAANERWYRVSGWKKEKDETLLTMQLLSNDNVLVGLQEKTLKVDNSVVGFVYQSGGQVGWLHSYSK